jgi:hypothetical protein
LGRWNRPISRFSSIDSVGKTFVVLRNHPDALGDELVGLEAGDVVALEVDRAAADVHLAEHRLEERRLAGPVGPDDADELPGVGGDVTAVEDVHAGDVPRDEVGAVQHRLTRHGGGRPRGGADCL